MIGPNPGRRIVGRTINLHRVAPKIRNHGGGKFILVIGRAADRASERNASRHIICKRPWLGDAGPISYCVPTWQCRVRNRELVIIVGSDRTPRSIDSTHARVVGPLC